MQRPLVMFGFVLLAMVLGAGAVEAQQCHKVKVNTQGIARADITVSTTAVNVLVANTSRCEAMIYNNSANDMRCADVDNDAVPTATTGFLVGAGKWLALGLEGQARWQCIRAGATDALATVAEALP